MPETNISLEDIRRLCLGYDKQRGPYPEDEYQGYSVYLYIEGEIKGKRMTNTDLDMARTSNWIREVQGDV